MYVEDSAPAFLCFRSPYGGLGLRTKSAAGARARIDGLLGTMADGVAMRSVELTVSEPAERALVESLVGAFSASTAWIGSGAIRGDLAEAMAAAGHRLDELAGEAWRRFGAPNTTQGHQDRQGQFHVGWSWLVENRAECATRLDEWFPYLAAHDQLMLDDSSTRVQIRAVWNFRLRSANGTVVAAPYPESEIHAHLRGRHASAFLDLVFPYTRITAEFLADHDAVCNAMGMGLSVRSFRLNAPKKRGGGRVLSKV